MRRFSRWMPPAGQPHTRITEWLFLAGLVGAIVTAAIAWPVTVGVIFAALIVVQLIASQVHNRHLRRLAAQRPGESIGTFARAFDRRTEPFDPWVLRATWDVLQPYVRFRGGKLPLRPTDRLLEDLCIDPEELHDVCLQEVADRTGYSLEQGGTNPLYGQVQTVCDFVKFVALQPRSKNWDGRSTEAEPSAPTDRPRE